MDINKLIPEKYFYYVENFTRSGYKKAFEQYCIETAVFFEQLEAQSEMAEKAAELLVERVDALLPKRFKRKLKFFDLKSLLFLYTVPAAISRGSEPAIAFVDALQQKWNGRYPGEELNAARFEEINGSFNNSFMGFPTGGKL